METAILVVWAVGLLGALVGTLAVLKLAALVLGTLRDLVALARRTGLAAEGVAENLAVLPRLREAHEPEARARAAAGHLLEGLEGSGRSPADVDPSQRHSSGGGPSGGERSR